MTGFAEILASAFPVIVIATQLAIVIGFLNDSSIRNPEPEIDEQPRTKTGLALEAIFFFALCVPWGLMFASQHREPNPDSFLLIVSAVSVLLMFVSGVLRLLAIRQVA